LKFNSGGTCERELLNDLAQPLRHCDANYVKKWTQKGGIVDGSRTAKAQRMANGELQTQTPEMGQT